VVIKDIEFKRIKDYFVNYTANRPVRIDCRHCSWIYRIFKKIRQRDEMAPTYVIKIIKRKELFKGIGGQPIKINDNQCQQQRQLPPFE
jgi:hypothetical protein